MSLETRRKLWDWVAIAAALVLVFGTFIAVVMEENR